MLEMFPLLARREKQDGSTLSGGEQQMLALARALMGRPRLLLADEVSLGLAPVITKQVFGHLQALREQGMTIVIVEQNAHLVMKMADHVYVLKHGRVVIRRHGRGDGDPARADRGLPRRMPEGTAAAMHDYELEERTMGRILAEKAARIPDKTFLMWEGRAWSYGELEAMTNRYANGFAAHGIGHGDHVAVMLPNCPEFFWVCWGLGKIGAVAVPINTAAKGELLRYFIDQSDASCVVVDDEWVDRVAAIARSCRRSGDTSIAAHVLSPRSASARRMRRCIGWPRSNRRMPRSRRSDAVAPRRHPPDHVHVGHHRAVEGRDVPAFAGPRGRPRADDRFRLPPRRRALHLPAALSRQRDLVHLLRRALGRRRDRAGAALFGDALLGRDPRQRRDPVQHAGRDDQHHLEAAARPARARPRVCACA